MSDPWTVQKALEWTSTHFRSLELPDARLDAELLLADVLKCKRLELYLRFDSILSHDERKTYREAIQRRIRREPVQYILGKTEFMSLTFQVSSDVLIPRPETEHLVDLAVEYARDNLQPPLNILDIGTGSGCIAVALAKQFPAAKVSACEKSVPALRMAQQNAAANEVEICFITGDFFEEYSRLGEQFDLIVSNPPYIATSEFAGLQPEVRDYEPRQALIAGEDGLDFYRGLAPLVSGLLRPSGCLLVEVGHTQAKAVAELFAKYGCETAIAKDYNRIERVVSAKKTGPAPPSASEPDRPQ